MNEILDEIRNAEKKASSIVESAKKRGEEIIKEAVNEAKKLEELEINKYYQELEEIFIKEMETIKKEAAAIVGDGNKNAMRLRKKSESNHSKALEFLSEKFREKWK